MLRLLIAHCDTVTPKVLRLRLLIAHCDTVTPKVLNEERGYKRGGARPNLPPRKRKDLKMDSFKNCMRELYSIATIENTSEALSGP